MFNSPVNSQMPYYAAQSPARVATLMQRVTYLLSTALLVTAGAAYAGRDLPPALGLPLIIGTFVCIFALMFARRVPVLNLVLLYTLSTLEGLMFGPILAMIIRGFALGGQIVAASAVITSLIMVGLGSYVWVTNKDFGYLGRTLFWVLLGLVAFGFIGLFWHNLFAMPGIYLLYEFAIVAVFVGFTLYDFSNIKLRYGPEDYVIATVQLYLNFLNLFWAILQIILSLTGGGGQRRN